MTASTDQKFDLAAALKDQQWERCKGELRALVALQGSYHSAGAPSQPKSHAYERMERASAAVESFIREFADEGLAE